MGDTSVVGGSPIARATDFPPSSTVVSIAAGVAETKEHLGGFWVVDVSDLDAALALAEKGSRACRGPVEVRPFQDEPPA